MKHYAFSVGVLLLCACGFTNGSPGSLAQTDTQSVPVRHGTVISDGCTLDSWQLETLGTPEMKAVVDDVVLLCLLPHADGSVTPNDPSGTEQLAMLVTQLQGMGYGVALAADFVTDNGNVFDGTETAQELSDSGWSAKVATNIALAARGANEVDLDLELLPASAKQDLTQLVTLVAAAVHPQTKLGIFLPPATMTPSDVPGGDAFDVATIAQSADRFRVLTLDYAGVAPGTTPGPTIDSGWAVDAVRFALTNTGNVPVDVSFPLYGNDFTTSSLTAAVRSTTFLEAVGLGETYGQVPTRAPTQELVLDYTDDTNATHELWYDDARSTVLTLGAWDYTTLPSNIGVVFYGLGAEDPALWNAVAKATVP